MNPVFSFDFASGPGARLPGAWVNVKPGKAAAVHDYANSVSGAEEIAGGPEINVDGIHLARFQKRRLVIGFPVSGPLDAIANRNGAAIRINVAKAHHKVSVQGVG